MQNQAPSDAVEKITFLGKFKGLRREHKLFIILGIPIWILNIILLYGSVYPVQASPCG